MRFGYSRGRLFNRFVNLTETIMNKEGMEKGQSVCHRVEDTYTFEQSH